MTKNLSTEKNLPAEKKVAPTPTGHTRNSAKLKVAVLGFGTVGASVAKILCELKPKGLELTHIFNRGVARKRVPWVPNSVQWTEDFNDVLASGADVVVELAGGLDPAGEWVR